MEASKKKFYYEWPNLVWLGQAGEICMKSDPLLLLFIHDQIIPVLGVYHATSTFDSMGSKTRGQLRQLYMK
jgi:hypothetical protein